MIRQVNKNEKLKNIVVISSLLYDIFYEAGNPLFINHKKTLILKILKEIFLQDNHYFNYQHCFIYEDHESIKGITMVYFHDDIKKLQLNSLKLIKAIIPAANESYLEINDQLSKPNELYIDVLAVSSSAQNQGIGTKLIEFIYQTAHNHQKVKAISLNVEQNNHNAKRLYKKLKFVDDEIITINGHQYDHMIRLI